MKNYINNEEKNAALDFAYAMGLKRPVMEESETESAISFANAMGLKWILGKAEKRNYRAEKQVAVPRLRFI